MLFNYLSLIVSCLVLFLLHYFSFCKVANIIVKHLLESIYVLTIVTLEGLHVSWAVTPFSSLLVSS